MALVMVSKCDPNIEQNDIFAQLHSLHGKIETPRYFKIFTVVSQKMVSKYLAVDFVLLNSYLGLEHLGNQGLESPNDTGLLSILNTALLITIKDMIFGDDLLTFCCFWIQVVWQTHMFNLDIFRWKLKD